MSLPLERRAPVAVACYPPDRRFPDRSDLYPAAPGDPAPKSSCLATSLARATTKTQVSSHAKAILAHMPQAGRCPAGQRGALSRQRGSAWVPRPAKGGERWPRSGRRGAFRRALPSPSRLCRATSPHIRGARNLDPAAPRSFAPPLPCRHLPHKGPQGGDQQFPRRSRPSFSLILSSNMRAAWAKRGTSCGWS